MKTDIQEFEDHYEMKLELPGYDKADIKVNLKDGNLTIEADRHEEKDEKDEKTGNYIRRERYEGKVKRAFYVGENVRDEDIYARLVNMCS